jgi:hypothetical protein
MVKRFETFTFGDLDKYEKQDLEDEMSWYSDAYEFVKDYEQEIKEIIEDAVITFKSKVPIFDKIHIQLVKDFHSDRKTANREDGIGLYVHESCLRVPIILIGLEEIYEAVKHYDTPLEVAIKSTIYHELGHAMVDLDEQIEFVKDENILQFEDEEEYVEDFAFNFEMFGRVPEEIDRLVQVYKEYKIKK